MIRRIFLGMLLVLPTLVLAAGSDSSEYKAGTDYSLVTPALPGEDNGKVQVVELFWYGCPHCYHFESYLHDWQKKKPDYVEFIRVPAIFNNPRWELDAKAYYTADVLGIMDKFHTPFFNAIHRDRKRMTSKDDIREFFASIGVDNKTFDDTFDSFAVQSKVRRAADLTRKYGISGVPSVAVAGKYLTDGPMAKSYDKLLRIVDALAAKEHAAKEAAAKTN